jgi:ATP-dependent helicase/nuclease subunit A
MRWRDRVATRGGVYLLSWPPGTPAPTHLSLLQRKDNEGCARAQLIDAESRAAAREDANLLYVALTRARQFLFASGVSPANSASADSWLERLTSALNRLPGALPTEQGGLRLDFGDVADCNGSADSRRGRCPCRGSAAGAADRRASCVGAAAARPDMGNRPARLARGNRLRRAVSGLPAGLDAAQWRELESIARRLVASDGLRRFFDPAQHRWAASELEFVLPDGNLGRIDRLVEFDDEIWILDYKSGPGDAFAEAYAGQLDAYVAAVGLIRPGKTGACRAGPAGWAARCACAECRWCKASRALRHSLF